MSFLSRLLRKREGLLGICRSVGEYVQPPPRIEEHTKHRKLLNLYDLFPEVGEFTHIAPTASLVGEVYLDDCVNIWEGSVIRGDLNAVRLMYMVSIRENTCISTVSTLPTGIPSFTNIGPMTVIQPGCTLISCTIGQQCLIGAKSVILEGAKIEDESIIGPNSVVPPGRLIPSHQLWAGNPVKYIRDLTKSEIWTIRTLAHEK